MQSWKRLPRFLATVHIPIGQCYKPWNMQRSVYCALSCRHPWKDADFIIFTHPPIWKLCLFSATFPSVSVTVTWIIIPLLGMCALAVFRFLRPHKKFPREELRLCKCTNRLFLLSYVPRYFFSRSSRSSNARTKTNARLEPLDWFQYFSIRWISKIIEHGGVALV